MKLTNEELEMMVKYLTPHHLFDLGVRALRIKLIEELKKRKEEDEED